MKLEVFAELAGRLGNALGDMARVHQALAALCSPSTVNLPEWARLSLEDVNGDITGQKYLVIQLTDGDPDVIGQFLKSVMGLSWSVKVISDDEELYGLFACLPAIG